KSGPEEVVRELGDARLELRAGARLDRLADPMVEQRPLARVERGVNDLTHQRVGEPAAGHAGRRRDQSRRGGLLESVKRLVARETSDGREEVEPEFLPDHRGGAEQISAAPG